MPEEALRSWAPTLHGRRVAVAFSGGLDSTVLLHALVRVIGPARVVALHVHHGLQPDADAWLEHCRRLARQLEVHFDGLRVADRPPAGASIEQWARDARRRVLGEALAAHGIEDLLTAHHADDQVETIVLRLARGAGLAGMAGMAVSSRRPGQGGAGRPDRRSLPGRDAAHTAHTLWRPFLGLPRSRLLAWARAQGLAWIEDPSNADRHFPRNALRHEVLPALSRAMPGWDAAVLRNAEHWRAAAEVLHEVATADLASASDPQQPLLLDRRPLQALSPARQGFVLRAWLTHLGLRAPATARLEEMRRQLLLAEAPLAVVEHDGLALCRDADRIVAWPAEALQAWRERRNPDPRLRFEARVADTWRRALADLKPDRPWRLDLRTDGMVDRGCLVFSCPGADGPPGLAAVLLDAGWLLAPGIGLDLGGAAGWSMRLSVDRPGRSLKHHHQAHRVPPWLRCLLPVIGGAGRVVYSAAYGLDRRSDLRRPPPGQPARPLALHWEPPALLGPLLGIHRLPRVSDPGATGDAQEGGGRPV